MKEEDVRSDEVNVRSFGIHRKVRDVGATWAKNGSLGCEARKRESKGHAEGDREERDCEGHEGDGSWRWKGRR